MVGWLLRKSQGIVSLMPKSSPGYLMKSYWRVLLLAPVLLIGACLAYAALAIKRDSTQATATAEIEASLTIQHGAEVRAAIENFEKNWLSLEAHTNPNIQFDMTIERDIERDWENELAWEKKFLGQQIMGDLPQEKCPHMK